MVYFNLAQGYVYRGISSDDRTIVIYAQQVKFNPILKSKEKYGKHTRKKKSVLYDDIFFCITYFIHQNVPNFMGQIVYPIIIATFAYVFHTLENVPAIRHVP